MDVQTLYHYLAERPDKGTPELYIRDTGVRASTIWHDRYVSQMYPCVIAQDRDLPVDAVYEALAYCQEHRGHNLPSQGSGARLVAGTWFLACAAC